MQGGDGAAGYFVSFLFVKQFLWLTRAGGNREWGCYTVLTMAHVATVPWGG